MYPWFKEAARKTDELFDANMALTEKEIKVAFGETLRTRTSTEYFIPS